MAWSRLQDAGTQSTQDAVVSRGEVRLALRLCIPSSPPPFPCVIFVHGLGSSKESPRNVAIARRLVDAGIAALLFDLNGHGDSSLDTQDGETGYIEDLATMFDWASRQVQFNRNRIGIAGSSLGGAVALHTVIRHMAPPTAMVLRAPPVESHDLAGLSVPTLVIVGSQDPLITTLAEVDRANEAVSLCVVKGASHLFEEPGTLEVATNETVRWFREHLGAPKDGRPFNSGFQARHKE